jgi:CheY-like chemotaxis protein
MTRSILLGIPDLLLSSRVNSVARTLGIPATATFTPHDLFSKAHGENASLLLIDLAADQLDPVASIRNLREDLHTTSLKIIGFVQKPTDPRKELAEEAGCDLVISKSQLLEALPEILQGLAVKD